MKTTCAYSFLAWIDGIFAQFKNFASRREPVFRPPVLENSRLKYRGAAEWFKMTEKQKGKCLQQALNLSAFESQKCAHNVDACLEIARQRQIPIEISVTGDGGIWAGIAQAGFDWEPAAFQFEQIRPVDAVCRALLDHAGVDIIQRVL
jgi:hypothetical protein